MANSLALRPIPARSAEADPAARRHSRSTVVLLVILATQLMVVLDTTIVNVALPHIQQGLGFSSSGLSWVLNAYLLTFGGLLLLGARAGDLLGRRATFLAGIGVFAASSLLGGLAASSWQLLAARALQGVGAALAAPSALALLTTVFSEGAQRVRAIGLFTTVSAAGGAVGLVAGGILTELVSWRWVMFVNVPIGLAVLLIGRVVLTETPRRHGRFDLAGALTSTLGMSAVVLGLVEAASRGWGAPITIWSLVVGATLLAAFVRIEAGAEEPILPLRLFADPTRSAANVARGLLYAAMFGMFFFLGQFLQDVQHYSPLRAGLCFLPVPATVFLSSQLTSRVLVRRVPAKTLMLAGIGCSLVSLLALTQLHAGAPYLQLLASLVLMGLGAGSSLVTLTAASLAAVAPEDAGAASGLVNVTQQVGAALGLAVLVTVSSAATSATVAAGRAAAPGAALGALSGLDVVFAASAIFAVAAFALVAAMVRLPVTAASAIDDVAPLVDAHDRDAPPCDGTCRLADAVA
ncbi:MAG TPA: MFS transporter [Acidimicrobiales bacterium]|jgi:EmrB/QacA subfamily drug resistance transporter|nr:MFS transporter [Acidimicrobiales bacterium]